VVLIVLIEQPSDSFLTRCTVQATHKYDGSSSSASVDHVTWSATANDTSVLLVSNGAEFNGSYIDFKKSGYSTNLNTASFWGFNAAINVVSIQLEYH
jgi:hypothetical protein